MGEGHWVEVRVVPEPELDEKRCLKAVRQLRKELAEEGLPTQDVVERPGGLAQDDGSIAIAVTFHRMEPTQCGKAAVAGLSVCRIKTTREACTANG